MDLDAVRSETWFLRKFSRSCGSSARTACATDVVLAAPLRRAKAKRPLRRLLIYLLIEHQSQPDRLMPLRSLDYLVRIYRRKVADIPVPHVPVREWPDRFATAENLNEVGSGTPV